MTEHIKIPDIVPLIRYVADGTQTVFEYPFPIFASTDLEVYFNGVKVTAGFSVGGVGQTLGGTVTFLTAPANNLKVMLKRELPIERLTDFLEGGDFSAAAINAELDFMIASIQQVERQNDQMIRYPEAENPASFELPPKSARIGKALGFDENGDPIALTANIVQQAPNYTASGVGAVIRTMDDKMKDIISVKDFGAVGDGMADDTLAINLALAAYDSIYLPRGIYRITSPIVLRQNQRMTGEGQTTIIRAQSAGFNAIELHEGYITLQNLRVEKGAVGVKLYGVSQPCVQNTIKDVTIWESAIGIQLDGYDDTAKPCYWNHFQNILVAKPSQHGVHLCVSDDGDTPNANKFIDVRVYSLDSPISGYGFNIEAGRFNNAFIDCEANLHTDALACFRLGAGADTNLISNLYTETQASIPNIQLDSGSQNTSVINLLSASAGPSIYDLSGGKYTAYNAGFPYKNKFDKTIVKDLTATIMRYDTAFINEATPATIEVDGSVSYYLVSAFNGETVMELPDPLDLQGQEITFKKIDTTGNLVIIKEESDTKNPDGRPIYLGGPNDYATVLSDGAKWMIKSSNRMAGNTRYYDGTGLYEVDMAVDAYMLSSYSGALEARLPPANAPEAIGRMVSLKKTDPSVNVITITEQGGDGADGQDQLLSNHFDAITLVSDGAFWRVLSRFDA